MPRGEKTKMLWKDIKYRKNMIEKHLGKISGMKGKKHTESAKEKNRLAHLGKQTNLGKHWKVKDTSNMRGGQNKGKHWKIKDTSKMKIASMRPEVKEKRRIAQLNRKNLYKNTSIELKIKDELIRRGFIENIDFFRNTPVVKIANVDFYFPKQKLIIQCDGDYWHNLPGRQKKDKEQDKKLKEKSYQVYRFWEHEINESPEVCLNKIKICTL